MVVLIDNRWILFKHQDSVPSGFSASGFEFLVGTLKEEEILRVLRTIRKYVIIDETFEANLDSIIEKSFKECEIDDPSIIEAAKSNLKIELTD
jgi:flagellar biosynthesis regulator FlbT